MEAVGLFSFIFEQKNIMSQLTRAKNKHVLSRNYAIKRYNVIFFHVQILLISSVHLNLLSFLSSFSHLFRSCSSSYLIICLKLLFSAQHSPSNSVVVAVCFSDCVCGPSFLSVTSSLVVALDFYCCKSDHGTFRSIRTTIRTHQLFIVSFIVAHILCTNAFFVQTLASVHCASPTNR